jgi:hypothetical protein
MKVETKKTYTFATLESVMGKARKKAFKDGTTVSEVVDKFLKSYTDPGNRNRSFVITKFNDNSK